MTLAILVSVAAILIATSITATVRWAKNAVVSRRAAKAVSLAAQEEEARRLDQRRRVAKNRAVAKLVRETRLPGTIGDDPWAGTSATGYGARIRDDLRRKGLTPADYMRGER